MRKLIIQSKTVAGLLKTLGGGDNTEALGVLNKALSHKYIRRWPAKNGKGWAYLYPKDFLTPIAALLTLFGFKKEKLEEDYAKHTIQQDYGADKKTFAAHALEYFSNKLKWDAFFAKKEHRENTKKPVKQAAVKKTSGATLGADTEQGELRFDGKPPKEDTKPKLNVSLMRKVWGIYSGQEAKDERKDSAGTGRKELPAGTAPVRAGGGKEHGDQHVPETEAGDHGGTPVQLPFDFGERPPRAVRLTVKQTKSIRESCLELLKTKTDAEMTEEDKALLRQYEGAGGLGEADATTHGTLYEFYTPRNVVNKVWQLVDKHLPGRKNTLEPSAGIGRFAENRPLDKFTLNELDDVSSRIAGILNPDAEITHGAFQALFKPGKAYEGKTYDCVIGNPPYGAYAGLWKGKGEGKEHNRYEEYFIDRGLDTLRDGGIMAFVLPSGFLDGANDKIKAKIAAKGRLLEAWRLPNGVFNTTGVGTDIVIIRKEHGEEAAFSDGSYFKEHSTHILGDVTERVNQFGKTQTYVSLPPGETFDGVIDGIPADAVAPTPVGEPPVREAAEEAIRVKKVTESEAEKQEHRSEALRGNQNARKQGFTVVELPEKTGKYAVKVSENSYMGDGGGGLFGGMVEFASAEAAEHAMNEYADNLADGQKKKEDRREKALARNREWIKQALEHGADVSGAYLIDPTTGGRLKLDADNQSLLNELRGEGTTQDKAVESSHNAAEHRNAEAVEDNHNAAGRPNVDSAAEFNEKYNKHIAPQALPVWKATRWDGSIGFDTLDAKSKDYIEQSGNYARQADGKWYDVVNFASGNIYDKLERLERTKAALTKGEYERQKAILEGVLPKPKAVHEFEVSPLSAFAEKFTTSEAWTTGAALAATSKKKKKLGDAFDESARLSGRYMTLTEAFKQWIREADAEELALNSDVTTHDILNYVDKARVVAARAGSPEGKEAARAEAARTVKARREAAERLFNQYIRERLSLDDQKRLATAYNRQYNGVVSADITKIPVFLDGISREFKGKEFRANDSQIKGVSWTANQGNGIIAFDVGIGKTITAIMAAMNDVQMGRCQKPIICVPKAVYKNWIHEISQLFPGVKINALGNFGDVGAIKNKDGTLNIQKGSLTLCTREALAKIGFKDETLKGDLREAFSEALSALTEEDKEDALQGKKKAKKKEAKDKEDIMTKVGKASRTGEHWVNWEDTGFDHITVDEAHGFRNSFSRPKNLNPGEADEFKDVPGGSTSLRGLKLFAITQMIQKHNNGRNVHLLTATPFQNSPGEIYNMLSYVAREKLREAGIENYHEFLTQFIALKSELSVDSKGNVTDKNVVKGFKNLGALQSLLNQYIMKIDGEDAGIVRPDKTEHIIELNPTAEQRDITERIREYMESNPDPKKDPGATLRCLNALRQAALSPALVDGFEFLAGNGEITVKNNDFVKSSPKMTFVCDTASRLYQRHPDKGQIIHLPQGVSHYPEVKQYLVSQGVPEDAIAFLAPEYLKAGDAGNDQKEEITQAFNDPENKLKIIIGSDTIREGVNLNGNTIQTYECMLAWNPTDTQQLKGRSWRQGNKQGMVHMTFPLMNDSVDSFMYQKHDEKGTRLDTLYNAKKDHIDVEGIDPEALKFALIKDPKKRADMEIKAETAELKQKQKIAESVSDKVFTMAGEYKSYEEENAEQGNVIENLKKARAAFAAQSDDVLKARYDVPRWVKGDISPAERGRIRDVYLYDDTVGGTISGKSMKELREKYDQVVQERIAGAQKTAQRNKGKMETLANTLSRYGVTDAGDMAMAETVREKYGEQALSYKARIRAVENNREQRVREAAARIQAESRPGVSVDEAVRQNTKAVGENLYSMDVVKSRVAKEQAKRRAATLQKALGTKKLVIVMKRRTA
jgi:SNF2 family DNA or RNA helicase